MFTRNAQEACQEEELLATLCKIMAYEKAAFLVSVEILVRSIED